VPTCGSTDLGQGRAHCCRIIVRLQGPRSAVGKFKDGKVTLEEGAHVRLDAAGQMGDNSRRGWDDKELPRDVRAGAVLLLDDGKSCSTWSRC